MNMHNICLYLPFVWEVVEVTMSVDCEYGCMVVSDSVYVDRSVYHFCKTLWANRWKRAIKIIIIICCAGVTCTYKMFQWNYVGRNLFALFMLGILFFIINWLIEYKFFITWRSVNCARRLVIMAGERPVVNNSVTKHPNNLLFFVGLLFLLR